MTHLGKTYHEPRANLVRNFLIIFSNIRHFYIHLANVLPNLTQLCMELVTRHQNVEQKVALLMVTVLQDLEYAVHLSKSFDKYKDRYILIK